MRLGEILQRTSVTDCTGQDTPSMVYVGQAIRDDIKIWGHVVCSFVYLCECGGMISNI